MLGNPIVWRCAVLLLLIIIVLKLLSKKDKKECFASERAKEIYSEAKPLMDRTQGNARYTDYKTVIKDADVVQYTGVRNMWKGNSLSPENIETLL